MAATIRVIPCAIIEVRPGALGQILHPPGDISGRPGQVYLPFDEDWNDLDLIWTPINAWVVVGGAEMRPLVKLSHGQLLKSSLGPLARYFVIDYLHVDLC